MVERRRGAIRHAFERDQRNVAVAAGAQTFEHVHQLAIRDAAVGAQEDAAVLAFARHRVERAHQIDALDRRFADGDREIGFDGDVGRLVGLLLRHRRGGRQIDRQIDGRQRRSDHEDDEQHQHDVDEGRDVDVMRLAEFVAIVIEIAENSRHRPTPPPALTAGGATGRDRATTGGRPRRSRGRHIPDRLWSRAKSGCR